MKPLTKLITLSLILFTSTSCAIRFENNSSSIETSSFLSSESSSSESSLSEETSSEFTTSISSSEIDEEKLWDETQDYLRSGEREFLFYNLNDFHGAVEKNLDNMEVGISYISSYLFSEKENNPNSGFIFTNSGDMWQGSADSNITRGELVIEWLNLLDCKAQSIGNHEFDWGVNTIEENISKMDFPLLGCNVIDEDSGLLVDYLKPYTTITVEGLHIGIIGVIGDGLESSILQSNIQGVDFVDPVPLVQHYSDYLKEQGADFILLLNHDDDIYDELYGYVDLVFNGHTHSYQNELLGNEVPVLQAYCNGRDISKCVLTYDFATNDINYNESEVVELFNLDLENDTQTDELYQYYLDNYINDIKNEVVGYATNGISYYDVPILSAKYAYQYYLDYGTTNYDIVSSTTNSARSEIDAGEITYGDIYKSLPFDNMIEIIKIPSSQVSYFKNFSGYYYDGDGTSVDGYSYIITIDYLEQKYVSYRYECEVVDSYPIYPRDLLKMYIGNDYPIN